MFSVHPCTSMRESDYNEGFEKVSNHLLDKVVTEFVWAPIVWADGRRLSENFLYSDFLCLDFDEHNPDECMDQVARSLQDTRHCIVTTKSHTTHQERYRLIIPWERRIDSAIEYEFNYFLALAQYDWADKSGGTLSRYFFPGKEIISLERTAEYVREVRQVPKGWLPPSAGARERILAAREKFRETQKIPNWILAFINYGQVSYSRNMKIYGVALELLAYGFPSEQVFTWIKRAPIEWKGLSDREVWSRIHSAEKNLERMLRNG